MPTLCLPVVCSLPAREYSQLFVFSMRCDLTTPPFMQVLPIKRRSSCDIGARYCDALCAAMMTQFLYRLSCSFRLGVAAVERNCARESCTSWCGDTRGLCAQQWFGWVTNVFDYRSNGAALCCALSHQHWWTHPLSIVVPHALRGRSGTDRSAQDLRLLAQTTVPQAFVVYCKPPFGGPEYVLQYLGRYTHRVAISNHRLISLADDQVTFRWRDSAHNNQQRVMSLSLVEFLTRFLLHLLPKGFIRIRHFGFLANRRRATVLPLCWQALDALPPPQAETRTSTTKGITSVLALS